MSNELKGALAILAVFACFLGVVWMANGLLRAWVGY